MIKLLNNLEYYCENCPYMVLTHYETLGSGKHAYTCKYKGICKRCIEKVTEDKTDTRAEHQKDI